MNFFWILSKFHLKTSKVCQPSWLKAKSVSRPIWSGRHGFNSCHPQHEACFMLTSMLSTKQYACLYWDFNKANCLSVCLKTSKSSNFCLKFFWILLNSSEFFLYSWENWFKFLCPAARNSFAWPGYPVSLLAGVLGSRTPFLHTIRRKTHKSRQNCKNPAGIFLNISK